MRTLVLFILLRVISGATWEKEKFKHIVEVGTAKKVSCSFLMVFAGTKVNLKKSKVRCGKPFPKRDTTVKTEIKPELSANLFKITMTIKSNGLGVFKRVILESRTCPIGHSLVCSPGPDNSCPSTLTLVCPSAPTRPVQTPLAPSCSCLPTCLVEQYLEKGISPLSSCYQGCACVPPQLLDCSTGESGPADCTEGCCQQLASLFRINETQYILTNHSSVASTCDYRELTDTSKHPKTFRLQENCTDKAWMKEFVCMDEELRNECSTPNFVTWFDVISRCFHQDTEGKEIMDSSFCQPKPSENYLKNFTKTIDHLAMVVETNSTLKNLSDVMWDQVVPEFKEFCPGNFAKMIHYLNITMTKAPQFMANTTPSGLPQIQMLNCYIRTEAGKQFFLNPNVNQAIINLENAWGDFLDSEESLDVLNTGQYGWKGTCASEKLQMPQYIYNKSDKYWGYKSWNAFFSRAINLTFRQNKCNGLDNCMTSYGDSQRLTISTNLTLNSSFQAKNENYSLIEIFNGNATWADYFVGGSLMQTLFMPFNYHRYHASVAGEIVLAQVIPGVLYAIGNTSVPKFEGTQREKLYNWVQTALFGFINSLTYSSKVATRGVFIIKTNFTDANGNPIYVGEVAIGLQSISSVVINETIHVGKIVAQGDELGMFQYGGSSGLMIVSDPYFQWANGTSGPDKDLYQLNDKIGEFHFCKPGSGKSCSKIEDNKRGLHWGTALGFPVI